MRKILFIILFLMATSPLFAQDIIMDISGNSLKAKVLEISSSEIKYKKFTNQTGPTYTIAVSTVEYIKYSNGEIDKFAAKTLNNTNNNENVSTSSGIITNSNTIESSVGNQTVNTKPQNQEESSDHQTLSKSFNPKHDVLQSEFIVINSDTNKDKIKALIIEMNNAIVSDNIEKAWKILDDIEVLNKK